MTEYLENDFLQLSGLQHFLFCRRQWALIHIEGQWADNLRTVEGDLLHQRAHSQELRESRGSLLICRGMRVFSRCLGLSGQCDVVEFRRSDSGVTLYGCDGTWQAYPVEYKRGRPKPGPFDEAQLCAQAMCLEEMLCTDIAEGALYYGEPKRRTTVVFSDVLRDQVTHASMEMHDLFRRCHTPRVKSHKGCSACSLKDICLPSLGRSRSVTAYLAHSLEVEP